jgi:hypothetical protein
VICVSNYRLCKPSFALHVWVVFETVFCILWVLFHGVAASMVFEEGSEVYQIADDQVRKVFRASQVEENVEDRKEIHRGLFS